MQILWKSPAATYAQSGQIAVSFWHQTINRTDMEAILRITQQRVHKFAPRSVGLIIVMEAPSLSNFDSESRQLNLQLFQLIKPVIRVGAGVVEGDGIRATALRLAATAVNMATGVDVRVFSTVEQACLRVAEGMGHLDERMIIRDVASLRAAAASRIA